MTRRLFDSRSTLVPAALAILSLGGAAVGAPLAAPTIRISPISKVPACVTPDRLMSFLKTRNPSLDVRYKDIALLYRQHGDANRVRWDYAFFQMAIETNFLTFRRPGGTRADVSARQNNFAGIGTTGGGVPGDSYPDISTGVLAQIQHLVVYSGERIETPVAPRTRLTQDDILALSRPVAAKRPVTFQDLSGRWAVDRAYGRSILWVAEQFRSAHCSDTEGQSTAAVETAPRAREAPAKTEIAKSDANLVERPRISSDTPSVAVGAAARASLGGPITRTEAGTSRGEAVAQVPRPTLAARPPARLDKRTPEPTAVLPCRVLTASYGGRRTLLIDAQVGTERQVTALTVHEGFEKSMMESFLRTRAPGGVLVATFDDPVMAVDGAHRVCKGLPAN